MHPHPSWVEVSLTALQHNFRTILSYVQPEADVCAVVKSDAYGHGAGACALALQKEGAKWLGVSTVEEGASLRGDGVTARILVMGGFSRGEEEDIVQYQLTPALWDWNHVELLENAAEKLATKERIAVHLNVNTGMNQLGVDIAGLPAILEAIQSAPHIFLEGIFSHFAASEVVDGPHGERQLQLFGEALAKAEEMGIKAPLRHIANSSALASRPQSWFNLVRPGLAIYGYFLPFSSIVTGHADWSLDLPVKPALAWKTRIIQTREVAAGLSVGGSSGYVTEFPTKVAVLSVGYGDGLNHHLSSHGRVIIQNDYAAIIGNIGMDVTTVDVTGIPGVEVGDEVIIIGETDKRKITAWEHAGIAGTIPQEVLCNISSRVFRKYVE